MKDEQNPTYGIRVTRLSVAPPGEPLFGEHCTHFELQNEAAGEYIEIRQQGGHVDDSRAAVVTPEEWPAFREAIERLLEEIRTAESAKVSRNP